ncbi:hypothetical protein HanRHA438_Chr06g0248791 [Helianthus annuus]|nr:hypothetical protein HanIR_Chr06g0257361 [Helianthus annuus]KAJ0910115.1 hypothetical protein HanRHA438_Chr06g0248791 [Helianthus annuus]
MFSALPIVVDISALVTFSAFSLNARVTSASSPGLSSLRSSSRTPPDALLSMADFKHRVTRCFSSSELIAVPSVCLIKNSCNIKKIKT